MHIAGTIITLVGIVALVVACVMSLRRMQKLQDLRFKQQQPQEYKKLKADVKSYVLLAVGMLGFIVGFILLNFF